MPFEIPPYIIQNKKRIPYIAGGILGLLLVIILASSGSGEHDPSLDDQPSLKPVTIDGGTRWLFSWKDESRAAHDVLLLGNFVSQGEPLTRVQMYDDNGDGVWRCVVPLDPGQYAFKFLVNKNLLVSPTHIDVLERTMNGAGQVFVPNPDAPWVAEIQPADESTTSSFSNITFRLAGNLNTLNMGDVRVSLNGKPLAVSVDREQARFTARISDPAEGQYLLQVSGQDTAGNAILEYQSIFFYYRRRISQIASTGLDGTLAYRVLLPAFSTNQESGLSSLISRLDYLNDGKGDKGTSLGVRLLVLYGILPASDPWGSESTSFERTQRGYGDRALLGVLASECRKRGIRLIMHLNLAYISNQHEFFQETYGNPGSKRWDWFFFLNDTGTRYLGYADDPSLPRLNTSSEGAATYLLDIVRNWAASGIDGFLFEHADLLPSGWWLKVREAALSGSGKDDFLLAGSCHGSGDYVNQLFQGGKFTMAESLNHATELALAFAGERPEGISVGLGNWEAAIPRGGAFLRPTANREMPRLASMYGDEMRSRAALGFLLTGGGVPMLQWGDELDIRSPEPPLDRDPSTMDWSIVSNRQADPESTFSMVRSLVQLRQTWPELRRDLDGGRPVLRWMNERELGYSAWVRQTVPNRFFLGLMIYNRGRKEASPEFVMPLGTTPDGHYRGRDILMPSMQTVVARIKEGRLTDLTLPVKAERGFQLWIFERLTTRD